MLPVCVGAGQDQLATARKAVAENPHDKVAATRLKKLEAMERAARREAVKYFPSTSF